LKEYNHIGPPASIILAGIIGSIGKGQVGLCAQPGMKRKRQKDTLFL
jgi:hypothetical protein